MSLQEDFQLYTEKAFTLPVNTSNENKLILYGLYKQATVGCVNTAILEYSTRGTELNGMHGKLLKGNPRSKLDTSHTTLSCLAF